jgi:DNA-binding protein Fis
MVSKTQNLFEIIVVLVIGFIITVIINGFIATITYPVSAQTNSVGNMTSTMMESARFHLKTADELLLEGDTAAALDQINLAEIQLSLLNMDSQETKMNQTTTAAMEFIIGGSLSSIKMAANCIIDNQAMVRCM